MSLCVEEWMPSNVVARPDQVHKTLQAEWRQLRKTAPPAVQFHWLEQFGEAALNARVFNARRLRELKQELHHVRVEIGRRVCSRAWFILCWEFGHRYVPDTPCSCATCNLLRTCPPDIAKARLWPSIYVGSKSGKSYECWVEDAGPWLWSQLPSSPTGMALQRMKAYGTRITKRMRDVGRTRSKKKKGVRTQWPGTEKQAQQETEQQM